MSHKNIKRALASTLDDLTNGDYQKFCYMLVDRREEPRIRRSRVEGKYHLDVVDVMVSTFTERGALQVAVEILSQIDCNAEAEKLGKLDVSSCMLSSRKRALTPDELGEPPSKNIPKQD